MNVLCTVSRGVISISAASIIRKCEHLHAMIVKLARLLMGCLACVPGKTKPLDLK